MKFSICRLFVLSLLGAIVVPFVGCGKSEQAAQVVDRLNEQVEQTDDVGKTDLNAKGSQPDSAKAVDNSKPSAGMPSTGMAGTGMAGMGKMKFPAPVDMKFKDDVESNAPIPKSVSELVFTNTDGSTIKMVDYQGKQHVLLVFTEGFNGMLCPFCKTQTSRLVSNYGEFQSRNCEVIVVYPGPQDHLDEFIEAALKTEKEEVDQVPFPIVLDKEFAATNYFDIHSMHAHPSTYLIDKQGGVQFAYVGADMTADRPSVKALIEKLDEIEKN